MVKINSLWIGDLSPLERLSITSHLKHGHEYHLWTYAPLDAPLGVALEDGNEILPESEIFTYSGPSEEGGGSVSAFSNLFRYKLLSEREEWWCDTDVVCLRPWDFEDKYIIATEAEGVPATCVMKPPREVAQSCYEVASKKNRKLLIWGEIGPALFGQKVHHLHLQKPEVFCPVGWEDVDALFSPMDLGQSHAVHLWNEMWRREGYSKEQRFSPDCIYEQLKSRYLYDLL